MRHLIFLLAFLMLSCSDEPLGKSEGSFLQTANAQGNGPNKANFFNGGTATEDIVIDGAGFNLTFKNFGKVTYDHNPYIYFTNYYYMRRETTPSDPFNYRFLEETSDRDWLGTVSNKNTGRGTRFFLDGNPGSSNFEIVADEGTYKSILGNNGWINIDNLPVYETKEDAKVKGHYGIFKTSDGTIKTTN